MSSNFIYLSSYFLYLPAQSWSDSVQHFYTLRPRLLHCNTYFMKSQFVLFVWKRLMAYQHFIHRPRVICVSLNTLIWRIISLYHADFGDKANGRANDQCWMQAGQRWCCCHNHWSNGSCIIKPHSQPTYNHPKAHWDASKPGILCRWSIPWRQKLPMASRASWYKQAACWVHGFRGDFHQTTQI